jgi:tetratricopeptide (TPR) repeat protein
MNVRSLFLGLLVTASLCVPPLLSPSSAQPAEGTGDAETIATKEPEVATITNKEPTITMVTNVVNIAEVEELRTKLDALQRANDLALGRWSALLDQNSSLSNVLTDLQATLVSERKREAELSEEARLFNNRVMLGAGVAMFLVFLASYWFQLRCLNRVMEVTHGPRELHAPYTPALLEAASARESQLLEAVKTLENRIRQLEAPGNFETARPAVAAPITATAQHANGVGENGRSTAEGKIVDVTPVEMQSTATKVSVLLAKGEVLLETERLHEAVNAFTEALTIEPNNAEAHLKKGIALERMNRLEPALSCYNEALRINPKRSFAYVHKARVLAALHRYDEALSVYDVALGKTPQKATTTSSSTDLHRANAGG